MKIDIEGFECRVSVFLKIFNNVYDNESMIKIHKQRQNTYNLNRWGYLWEVDIV